MRYVRWISSLPGSSNYWLVVASLNAIYVVIGLLNGDGTDLLVPGGMILFALAYREYLRRHRRTWR